MDTNYTKQPTESSLYEENPLNSTTDVFDEEKNASEKPFEMRTLELTDDISSYLHTLTKVAKQKAPDMIINKDTSHSLCLMSIIIENAQKNVRILSLDDNIYYLCYELIFNSIKSAKQRGVNVEILTNMDVTKEGVFKRYAPMLKTIPIKVYEDYQTNTPEFKSFMTGDDAMYRFEYSLESINGLGSFNDSKLTESFNTVFEKLYKQC